METFNVKEAVLEWQKVCKPYPASYLAQISLVFDDSIDIKTAREKVDSILLNSIWEGSHITVSEFLTLENAETQKILKQWKIELNEHFQTRKQASQWQDTLVRRLNQTLNESGFKIQLSGPQ